MEIDFQKCGNRFPELIFEKNIWKKIIETTRISKTMNHAWNVCLGLF